MNCKVIKTTALLGLFLGLFLNSANSQTVEVLLGKSVFTTENEITFDVRCASEQDLEITVFTDNYLALQQKSTLLPGLNPFKINATTLPNGKYFILVTGNVIHVEKEFHLKR